MNAPCEALPLSFYVEKLQEGAPFTSLLYGDGEFLVAMKQRTKQRMAYGEIVTPALEEEMHASLLEEGNDVYRGSDGFLLDWTTYGGRDIAMIRAISERIRTYLKTLPRPLRWVDGTVWEVSQRQGEWNPLLKALQKRRTVLVGHPLLEQLKWLGYERFIPVPERNACAALDAVEAAVLGCGGHPGVYLLCMGLSAVPLAMRLRRKIPGATFLDLGSSFDVFVKLPTRGWRTELYQDKQAYEAFIKKTLEGVEC